MPILCARVVAGYYRFTQATTFARWFLQFLLLITLCSVFGFPAQVAHANGVGVQLTLGDRTLAEGDSGTVTFSFDVALSAASSGTVTVHYQTFDSTATQTDGDYVPTNGTVTFIPGDTEETIEVTVNRDIKVESDEAFTVELSNLLLDGGDPGTAVVYGDDHQAVGQITNDDSATISIDNVSHNEGTASNTPYTFTVSLSAPIGLDIAFDVETADDTALVSENDYTSISTQQVLMEANSALTRTIQVFAVADAKVEDDETFFVNLSNLNNTGLNVSLADSQGDGTILNDDSAGLSIDDVSHDEGEPGTTAYTFTVSLSAPIAKNITVDVGSRDDTATTADLDYSAYTTQTVTFTAGGVLTKSVTVSVNGDTTIEDDEDFFVNLGNVTFGGASDPQVTITDTQGLGTIENDDSATLSIDDVPQNEGDAGTTGYDFVVALSAPSDHEITVVADTADDTATLADNDYNQVAGQTITFAPGDPLTQTLSVDVNGDTKVENNDTFSVTLSSAQYNGATDSSRVTISDAEGTGTITNDDGATLSIDDVTQDEGDSGSTIYTFTVTLSEEVAEDVTVVAMTADDTATEADSDYSVVAGQTVTFSAGGGLTQTVTVNVTGDDKVEENESFLVNLSDPQYDGATDASRITIGDSQGVATVNNDDVATFSIDDVAKTEFDGGADVFAFTISLSAPVVKDVSVVLDTADDTATIADNDYTAVTGQLVTFLAGTELTRTVNVIVTGDPTAEDDETFFVELSDPQYNGATDASRVAILDGEGIGTILNNDAAGLRIENTSNSEGDSGTTLYSFNVIINPPAAKDVSVVVNTSDNSAILSDGDYSALSSQTITFTPGGSVVQSVTVSVTGDTQVENDETFFVNLSDARYDGVSDGTRVTFTDAIAEGTINNDDRAELSIDDVSQSEGNSSTTLFTFTVSLSDLAAEDVSVTATSVDGAASTAGGDITAFNNQPITVTAGTLTQTFTVVISGDTIVETDENFFVTLSDLQYNGVEDNSRVIFNKSVGTGTITNDDSATVSIADSTKSESAAGVDLVISLSAPTERNISVVVDTADSTATTADSDYGAVSAHTVTFIAGEPLTQTVFVSIPNDEKVEHDESFVANLSDPRFNFGTDATRVTIGDGLGEVTITNDDSASFSVDDVTLTEGDAGSTLFSFNVSLSREAAEDVTVVVESTDDSATVVDGDYTALTSQTLTFSPGGLLEQTVTVAVSGELIAEHDESFFVNLSDARFDGAVDATRVTIGDGQGEGKILNDDSVTLNIDDVSQTEGNSGSTFYNFTLSLSQAVGEEVTVLAEILSDSATMADNDYTSPSSETVTWAAGGPLTQTLTVSVTGDLTVEDDESFSVVLGEPRFDGAEGTEQVTLGDGEGVGTILNDDSATLSINDVTQSEGDAGTTNFDFTITLSAPSAHEVTVVVESGNDTATLADDDYDELSVQTITFEPGDPLTKTVSVAVNGDTTVEYDDTFVVNLSNALYDGFDDLDRLSIGDNRGIGTITNDDIASLSIDDVEKTEGNGGNMLYTFTVSLSAPVVDPVTVRVDTTDSSATIADDDYDALSDSNLFFPPGGALTQTVTVNVTGDTMIENDEVFFANLSDARFNDSVDASRATILDGQGEGTILNDDSASVSIDDVNHAEESAGNTIYTFTLTLSDGVAEDVTVVVNSADSTASVADGDYTAVSDQTVTFSAGDSLSETVTVIVSGDAKVENDESFLVNLSNVQYGGAEDARVTIADGQGSGTISNDDSTRLSIGDVEIAEGDAGATALEFTLSLSAPSAQDITVAVDTADGTATTGDHDYEALSGQTMTFAAGGALTQTLTVNASGDAAVEYDEDFVVQLSDVRYDGGIDETRASIGDGQGTGTIANDDSATLSIGNVTAAEGNDGSTLYTFTVSLSAPASEDVTVVVNSGDGSATVADADYEAVADQTVTVAAGALNQDVTVASNGDAKVENDEDFFVNLSDARFDGASDGSRLSIGEAQGQATIQNDDAATITVSTVSDLEANGPFVFDVALSQPVDAEVTVHFSTADGTATVADNDYEAVIDQAVIFSAGSLAQTVSVEVNDDSTLESDEDFAAILADLDANGRAVTLGAPGSGVIEDDEPLPSLSINDVGAAENDGVLTFTVTLSFVNVQETSVELTTSDDSAHAPDDYSAKSGIVVIPAGESSATIAIDLVDETLIEGNETFTVDLANPVNASIGDDQGVGTIENDDGSPVLQIEDTSNSEEEGTLSFGVTLDRPSTLDVTVEYASSDGTATAPGDYAAVDGQLTIAAGSTAGEIVIDVVDDELVESDETLKISLSNAGNAVIGDGQATGTISDNDGAAIRISKIASTELANLGDTITYTYHITNSGNVQLSNIVAVDDPLGAVSLTSTSLAPDARATGTLTHKVTLDDLPGPLVNDVEVTANGGGVTVEDSAQASVELINASLRMSKTVGIAGIDPLCTEQDTLKIPANSAVVYCYTVENTGEVPLNNHTLEDDHLGTLLSGLALTLLPGDTYSHTETVTLTTSTTNVATWTATAVPEADILRTAQVREVQVSTGGQAVVNVSADGDDEDGDSIPDNIEGTGDPDADNVPNFLDTDSDGDSRPDSVEVGPDPLNPRDSNGDGIPDYLDSSPTAMDPDEQPEQSRRTFLPNIGR